MSDRGGSPGAEPLLEAGAAPGGPPALLEAQGVEKEYRSRAEPLRVLKGVNLTVHEAELIAVVGASGIGKSTLLHVLGALDRPTAGTGPLPRPGPLRSVRGGADPVPAGGGRLRLPALQSPDGLLRPRERDAAGAHPAPPAGGRAPARRWTPSARSGSSSGSATGRASCPGASSSASPWRGRWSADRP